MKVMIIGARAGSSLMLELLKTRLKAWQGSGRETPIRDWIRNNYPKPLPEHMLKDDWEVTKAGELAFYMETLKKRYNPKFIYLARPVYQRVNSHVTVGYAKAVLRIYNNNKAIAREMDKFIPQAYNSLSPIDKIMYMDAAWFLLMREKAMPFSQVVYFKEFMTRFERTMKDLARYIGIRYDPRWKRMRKKKWQRTSRKSNEWIGQDWK